MMIKAVFLPGKLCDQRLWLETMNALTDIIDPIFVDLRSQQTLEEMLETVANSCQEKFILVGFSMGGYIAQEFVLRFPDKILGLALIAVSADEYNPAEKEQQLRFVNNVKLLGFKGLSDIAIQKFIHPTQYQNKEIIELIRDMSKESGADTFIYQNLATMHRRSRLNDLAKLICPTVIVASLDDQAVSLISIKKMHNKIAESEFHVIDNCGHMIPLEQPKQLTSILRTWITTKY